MSKKYHDGFFHICSAFLELHETISVRSLAPFLEIPRSTLQDGLKRVNHLNTDHLTGTATTVIGSLAKHYFEPSSKTISSVYNDGEIKKLYSLTVDETLDEDVDHSGEGHDDDDLVVELEDDDLEFDDGLDDYEDLEDTVSELNEKQLLEREKLIQEAKQGSFQDINDYVIRLARQKQRLQDVSREERKILREATRSVNVLEELNSEMIKVLKENRSQYPVVKKKLSGNKTEAKGVVQVSDLHLGEIVNETISNRFDMEVASKRLHKLAERTIERFLNEGITSVAIFMTGDMINSTRRISEITSYAAPRVKIVFHAYLLLGQFIEMFHAYFNVTIAHVVGNESRLSEYFDTTNYLASDNFDLMLYDMLKMTHEKEGMVFVDSGDNPMEQVVDVNGVNFLLVHGNGHSGISATNKIENEVQKIKARYAEQDIKIGYVVCGHIHSTYIAGGFARSASLVGSNAYSERQLNFTSRASQNIFIVFEDSSIEATMIDLQEYDGYDGFEFNNSLMTHKANGITAPVIHRMG